MEKMKVKHSFACIHVSKDCATLVICVCTQIQAFKM